jgi:hypothetical protein
MRGLFILVLVVELGSPGKQTDGNCYNKPFCEPCFICEATWGVAMQQQQKKAPNNSPTSSGSVKKN